MTTSFKRTPKHTQSDSTRHTSYLLITLSGHLISNLFLIIIPDKSILPIMPLSLTNAYHSLAPPSPPVTTPTGATASPPTPAHHLFSAMQNDETYLNTAHQQPLSSAMQHYVTYLKAVYKDKTTPVYDKKHCLLQVKAKSFINIALVHKKFPHQYMSDSDMNEMIMDRLQGYVDAIQQKKTKLHICNVCKKQEGDPARCVLVEGAPIELERLLLHMSCVSSGPEERFYGNGQQFYLSSYKTTEQGQHRTCMTSCTIL